MNKEVLTEFKVEVSMESNSTIYTETFDIRDYEKGTTIEDLVEVILTWVDEVFEGTKQQRIYIDPNGYERYSDSDRLVHVHIAEVYIIRSKLREDEVVHHINTDKLDNRANNLEVMTWREHKKLHKR